MVSETSKIISNYCTIFNVHYKYIVQLMRAIIIVFLVGGLRKKCYKEENVEGTGVVTTPCLTRITQ